MTRHIPDALKSGALIYHRHPRPGKIEVAPTKPLGNQRDLALAYSPGVAVACEEIVRDEAAAAELTARGNLVAVISNGTAVLGLGAIGPLASKPVMEGKSVLFKKFAGIDVFDLEVDATEIQRFCDCVAALEPTFGGINLEDIRGPDCFEIEEQLKARMNIPVFHDDQHGTAIIVAAAVRNGLKLAGKSLSEVKIVTSGAGAAALACLNLLVTLGAKTENIWVTDIDGVVYQGRKRAMDRWKQVYAQSTKARKLADIVEDADIFLGLSAGGVLKPAMVKKMAPDPLILALANPEPEIMPDAALKARPDVMMCTGRSDFPNQVNNVLCFPYIFRGALDVGATAINDHMKLAAAEAIAALAHEASSDVAARAYGGEARLFGRDSLIPTPFDPRLILRVAPAVAKAAMASGVATRPIEDFAVYEDRLNRFVFRSGLIMKPVFSAARAAPKRVIYAEGEDERILRAAQVSLEESIAEPILIGRPEVVEQRLKRYGLTIVPGKDFELIDPEDDPRYNEFVTTYLERTWRRGVTADRARTMVRTRPTAIGAIAVQRGEADALICGVEGRFNRHLEHISQVIGLGPGVRDFSTLSLVILADGAYFMADTYISPEPGDREIAEMACLAAAQVKRFGIEPRIALLSHSAFGSAETPSARKMRRAVELIRARDPDLEVEGEMHGDAALDEAYRNRAFPLAKLSGNANVLIMPNLDAANISYQLIKTLGRALPVGPILVGPAKPAHILTPSVTARGVVNMTALAVVEAQNVGA
jgi:malate dehydrogenase (oxaloacetate-decarboxylating)(NADP+)